MSDGYSQDGAAAGGLDPHRAQALREMVSASFRSRHLVAIRLTYVAHVFFVALLAFCMGQSISARDLRTAIAPAFAGVLAVQGLVVMKLWYWVVNTKLSILKEVRLLRIEVGSPEAGTPGIEEGLTAGPLLTPELPRWEGVAWRLGIVMVCLAVYLSALSPAIRQQVLGALGWGFGH
jgi:hypothetical protein